MADGGGTLAAVEGWSASREVLAQELLPQKAIQGFESQSYKMLIFNRLRFYERIRLTQARTLSAHG
jgi:hypothetical protein